VLGIVLLRKILQDASGFEQVDLLAIRKGVCQSRNTAIGIDFEKPGFLLRVLLQVNFLSLIGKPNDERSARYLTRSVEREAHSP
jgi:hypothetical protein